MIEAVLAMLIPRTGNLAVSQRKRVVKPVMKDALEISAIKILTLIALT